MTNTLQIIWLQKLQVFTVFLFRLQFHCSCDSEPLHAVDDCSPVDLQSKIRILCNLFIVNHIVEYLHLLHLKLNKSWGQAILSLHSFYLHFLHSAGSSYYWIYNTNFTCVSLQHPMSNNVVNTIFRIVLVFSKGNKIVLIFFHTVGSIVKTNFIQFLEGKFIFNWKIFPL